MYIFIFPWRDSNSYIYEDGHYFTSRHFNDCRWHFTYRGTWVVLQIAVWPNLRGACSLLTKQNQTLSSLFLTFRIILNLSVTETFGKRNLFGVIAPVIWEKLRVGNTYTPYSSSVIILLPSCIVYGITARTLFHLKCWLSRNTVLLG